ncbi:MAG: hypothetical protein WBW73_29090 [Rhodoplanes sp.]
MKPFLFSVAILLAAGPAFADTCKATADAKKLHGAALTSFMKKCERDSKAACDSQATDKKLAGAAKTSFTTKCVRDAVGQ